MFTAVPAVSDDAVAGVDDAGAARGARSTRAQRSSTSSRPRHQHRHARPIRAPSAAPSVWWCESPMIGRRGRSRATAEAVRPVNVGTRIARRAERLGQVAGGVRHRASDRRLLARLRHLVPVADRRLDRACDAVHRRDRLDRVVADGGLGGEHHRRRAVEDRVRDVARLGSRRLGVLDHRLEHLRRRDHGLSGLEAAQDDLLLQQRHGRRRRSRRRGRRGRP